MALPSLMTRLTFKKDNDFLREIWSPRPFISAGGYTRELAIDTAETKGDLIAVGRLFISNVCINVSKLSIVLLLMLALQPDLPIRWRQDIPALKGDRQTYYGKGGPSGYIDYPFADGSVEPPQYKPKFHATP
jgi:NADPH2 dehydrogenase